MALETQIVQVPIIGGMDTKTDERLVQPTDLLLLQDGELNNIGKAKTRDGYQEIDTVGTSGTKARCAFEYEDTMVEVIDQTVFDKSASQFRSIGSARSGEVAIKEVTATIRGKAGAQVASVGGYKLYAWAGTPYGTQGSVDIWYVVTDATTGNVVIQETNLSSVTSKRGVKLCTIGTKVFLVCDTGTTLACYMWNSSTPTTAPASLANIGTDLGTYLAFDVIAYDSTAMAFVYVTTTSTNAKIGYLKTDGALGNGSNGYPAVTTITDANTYTGSGVALTKQSSNGNLWFYYFTSSNSALYATARVGTTLANSVSPFSVSDCTSVTKFGHVSVCWESATRMCVVFDRSGSEAPSDQVRGSAHNIGNHAWTFTTDFPSVRVSLWAQVDTTGSLFDSGHIKWRCNIASDPFFFGTSSYVWVIYCGTAIQGGFFTSQNTFFLVRISDGSLIAKAFPGLAAQSNTQNNLSTKVDVLSNILSSSNSFICPLIKMGETSNNPFKRNPTVAGAADSRRPVAATQINDVTVDLSYVSKIEHKKAEDVAILNDGILKTYDGRLVSEIGFHTYPEALVPEYSTAVASVTTQGDATHQEVTTIKLPPPFRISSGDYISIYGKTILFGSSENVTGDITFSSGSYSGSAATLASSMNTSINFNSVSLGFSSTVSNDTLTLTRNVVGAIADVDVSNFATSKANYGTDGMSDGTYSWVAVYEFVDKMGNVHRSAPSPSKTVTISGMTATIGTCTLLVPSIDLTDKEGYSISVVLYRTVNLGTVYYRSSSATLPTVNYSSFEWIPVTDYSSDATISQSEILYTTGGVLENIAPPQAKTFHVAQDRAWVVPVEDPSYVWYSKTKVDGEGLAFNDTNILRVEPVSGGVNVVGSLDDKIVFFEDSSILFTTGDGPDDLGQGQFLKPEVISRDIGCPWKESIGYFPDGTIFKSKKGWYLLDRGLSLSYIGDKVEAYNDLTVSSTVTIPDKHQIRITHTDGACLVFDYFYKKWFVFTNLQAVDAFIYQDLFSVLFSDGTVWQETPGIYQDPGGSQISMIIETAWIKLNGFEGFQRVRRVNTLGSFKTGYRHNVKQYIDYSTTLVDNNYYENASNQIEFRTHLATQKCQAIKLRYEYAATGASYSAQEVSGFTLEIGVKKGLNKLSSTKTTNNSISA